MVVGNADGENAQDREGDDAAARGVASATENQVPYQEEEGAMQILYQAKPSKWQVQVPGGHAHARRASQEGSIYWWRGRERPRKLGSIYATKATIHLIGGPAVLDRGMWGECASGTDAAVATVEITCIIAAKRNHQFTQWALC
ncbi:hypothetical protein VDGL01_04398 [Verticillium dahliae]